MRRASFWNVHRFPRATAHVAIMQRRQIRRILTFDTGFDEIPGIARLG